MSLNLSKGQTFNLKKSNGSSLKDFCVGVNWGMIEKKSSGFLGIGAGVKKISVDLDVSVGLFDKDKNLIDTVSFKKLSAPGISHSGDDLEGDADGDDGLDNEIITISLEAIPSIVTDIAFVLNSFRGQDFASIPFASVRLYEGTPDKVNEVYATYDIANSAEFSGSVSMVLGLLTNRSGNWEFKTIGEPTSDRTLEQTLNTVSSEYL